LVRWCQFCLKCCLASYLSTSFSFLLSGYNFQICPVWIWSQGESGIPQLQHCVATIMFILLLTFLHVPLCSCLAIYTGHVVLQIHSEWICGEGASCKAYLQQCPVTRVAACFCVHFSFQWCKLYWWYWQKQERGWTIGSTHCDTLSSRYPYLHEELRICFILHIMFLQFVCFFFHGWLTN